MKTKLIMALATLLSVDCLPVGTASVKTQQKFSSLPVGANLDGYINFVVVGFGTTKNFLAETFEFNYRQDGKLESFAASKLRQVSSRFSPRPGQETDLHWWSVDGYTHGLSGLPSPYYGETGSALIALAPPPGNVESEFHLVFHNGKWSVPNEVFGKVKFQFGWGVGYYIPGVMDLEINLYNESRIARFSTRERISDADNPCELPATILALPDAIIPNEIATARPSWWERAEITLYTSTASVTFLVNRTAEDGFGFCDEYF